MCRCLFRALRFSPSAGSCLRCLIARVFWESRLAVGNWIEVVSEGQLGQLTKGSRMPLGCSDAKSHTSGMAKRRALAQLEVVVTRLKPQQPASADV